MSLASYEDARPWARAIREEVLTRRMPKWHAARGYGQFANDRSLTPFEIALIVAWVDGGAKKEEVRSRKEEVRTEGPASVGKRLRPERGAESPSERERGWGPATAEKNRQDVRSRVLTLPCGERRLPPGRLLALTPQLDDGGSAGISLVRPDGTREILAWIRGFEKEFAETYWLRTPADIPRGARLHVAATAASAPTPLFERRRGLAVALGSEADTAPASSAEAMRRRGRCRIAVTLE
jgi:hypothetical protein